MESYIHFPRCEELKNVVNGFDTKWGFTQCSRAIDSSYVPFCTPELQHTFAGPTLVAASLSSRFCIIGAQRVVRAVTHSCVLCRRVAGSPPSQVLGQLPPDRVASRLVFDQTGVDYARPVLIKSGSVRRPLMTKAFIIVFVFSTVEAVHLELVTELTTVAFITVLHRFVAHRRKPSVIWSDHCTNFVDTAKEIKELYASFGRWRLRTYSAMYV